MNITMRDFTALLDSVKDLSVLLIGETIIDEYVYVYPMAKSPKENVIATREDKREQFNGGVEVPYKILKTFCKNVDVVTQSYPIWKTRFVDHSYMRKLFEVYNIEDGEKLQAESLNGIGAYDLVLVFDFGHGFIDAGAISYICGHAKFLAVNVQSNSGNMGYNFIHKYPRADFVCIDEPEARLAAIDRDSKISEVIGKLKIDCGKFIITHGKHGCVTCENGEVSTVPAITERVLDTVGAGDTFLSYAAPLIAAGANIKEAAYIGTIAGGLKTSVVGHQRVIEKKDVVAWLEQNRT